MSIRGKAAIVGIGELAPERYSRGETTLSLLSRVTNLALTDAGLGPADIDGLVIHPLGGIAALAPSTMVELLGLRARFAEIIDLGGASGAGMILAAAAAIAAGQCSACLCLAGSPLPAPEDRPPGRAYASMIDGSAYTEFEVPYGAIGPNLGYAQIAQRYEYEYGPTAQARAKIAVHQRDNACAYPQAYFYGKPISADDVLNSRLIADPLHLLEIVMPTTGAAGVVVTSAEVAAGLAHPPAFVLGFGQYTTHRSIPFAPSLTDTAIRPAAAAAFAMAGVKPDQIGLASVYDCYTITVLLSLEDAGFCPKGSAARFVDEHDFHYDGDFPLNTHGGQLSYGQPGMAGGMSHVTEAALQVQGRAHGRQVRDLELAFVNGNGGIMSEQVSLVLGTNP